MTGVARASSATASADIGDGALAIYNRRRKIDNRERLLAAAMQLFCDRGYLPVSVDDIATAAGLSRMTLYRHFGGKVDLAAELFRCSAKRAEPRLLQIGIAEYVLHEVVAAWIASLFDMDRANAQVLRVFIQATVESGFSESAQEWISSLITKLGTAIPAFAVDRDRPDQRRRWLEAWLLLYEILDQSNHAALNSGVSGDPLVIDILAERFCRFVSAPMEHAGDA
jgi:AcrR family transcriptional regulator